MFGTVHQGLRVGGVCVCVGITAVGKCQEPAACDRPFSRTTPVWWCGISAPFPFSSGALTGYLKFPSAPAQCRPLYPGTRALLFVVLDSTSGTGTAHRVCSCALLV